MRIPVVIRGMRRAGSPTGCRSSKYCKTSVKQETLRLITVGDEDRAAGRAPIMELSDETYFYDPDGVLGDDAIPEQPYT